MSEWCFSLTAGQFFVLTNFKFATFSLFFHVRTCTRMKDYTTNRSPAEVHFLHTFIRCSPFGYLRCSSFGYTSLSVLPVFFTAQRGGSTESYHTWKLSTSPRSFFRNFIISLIFVHTRTLNSALTYSKAWNSLSVGSTRQGTWTYWIVRLCVCVCVRQYQLSCISIILDASLPWIFSVGLRAPAGTKQ